MVMEQSAIVRKKIRMLVPDDAAVDAELAEIMAAEKGDSDNLYGEAIKDFDVNKIVEGRVVEVRSDEVVVDIGFKAEGVVMRHEFTNPEMVKIGDKVNVLIESIEDDLDNEPLELSKRKADRILVWDQIVKEKKENDIVKGRITRKIKGGLLVDIGVPVFLPASQVDLRRAGDIGEYVGKEIECMILKIDEARKNIVVSRRKLLEMEREKKKGEFLAVTKVGDLVKGRVKNIADFGAFIDLGGVDGLLHITDMSWGRVEHPSKLVRIGQEIEVKVLNIDKETGKVALGLKQKTSSPWENIEEKYPVGAVVKGTVVNTTNYGAFVRLENGIEGLVHISEMSWTRRISHPDELVKKGDGIDVMVLATNKDKQEISLGIKQTASNPWEHVEEKYPAGTQVKGKVRNLTNYGAFVELEEGVDGLLHVSDISWTRKINHPSEVLKKGDDVEGIVLSVDKEKKRVSIGLKQVKEDPWVSDIPERYKPGDIITGKVVKTANFGAFVQIEPELEGLLHISEASDKKITSIEEVLKVGDDIEAMIIKVDVDERKIALSRKQTEEVEEGTAGAVSAGSSETVKVAKEPKPAKSKWTDGLKEDMARRAKEKKEGDTE